MATHDGHRQRLKERFRSGGLDNFTDVQVLELALFYCIPRRDTNPIAHALIEHFGSLSSGHYYKNLSFFVHPIIAP